MLIPYLFGFELLLIIFLINFLKNIFESPIVFLQYRIFCCKIERVLSLQCEFEATMSKSFNTIIGVVHTKTDSTLPIVMENFHFLHAAIIGFENYLKFAWFFHNKVSGFILITESMSPDDNRLLPAWHQSRNIFDDNRLTKNSTIQYISDGAIRTFPHRLQFKFLNPCLIRCNSRTLDPYFTLLNSIGSIDSNLVVGSISMFDP